MNTLAILQQILTIIFPLAIIVILGFLYARKYQPDMADANQMNIDIFCPALIFSVVSEKSFHIDEYWQLACAALLVLSVSGLVVIPVCRFFSIEKKTLLPPVMFNNTGNIGLPLMVLAFGKQALPAAVVLFIVENTLHFTLGLYLLDRQTNPLHILKKPMIFVTIIALAFSLFRVPVPSFLLTGATLLGQISIPLMLFALGVRMTTIDFSDWKIGLLGAITAPLSTILVTLFLGGLWTLPGDDFKYLLLFSALPPAVFNYILAEIYQQEPRKVASIVLIGNLAAIIVIPLTLFFIYRFL